MSEADRGQRTLQPRNVVGNMTAKQIIGARKSKIMPAYGYELILDLHDCDAFTFTRDSIDRFFTELCEQINMKKCDVHFWDDVGVSPDEQQTDPHTKGTSAVYFILTSTIVVHTLDLLKVVYVNIFSCKSFDPEQASEFTKDWYKGEIRNSTFIERQ